MVTVFMGVATIALAAIVGAMCFAFRGFLEFLGSQDDDGEDGE